MFFSALTTNRVNALGAMMVVMAAVIAAAAQKEQRP